MTACVDDACPVHAFGRVLRVQTDSARERLTVAARSVTVGWWWMGLWVDLQVMFVWLMLQTIPGDCGQKGSPGGPSDGEYTVSSVTRFNNKASVVVSAHSLCSPGLTTRKVLILL